MTKRLSFAEASAQATAIGYELIHYAGSSNAYGSVFKCRCGNTWSAKHNNVVSSNKTGCPVCAKAAAKLTAVSIESAVKNEAYKLVSIDSEIAGQSTVITTECAHGHHRTSKLGTIIYAKKPCPDCSKIRRGVDFEGFNARLAKDGYTITEWGGSTRAKGVISCKCGHTWSARINSVLRGGSHCPNCFEGGFRGDKPAVLYVYEMRKGVRVCYGYGISGRFDSRDAEHRRNAAESGWAIKPYRIFEFEKGVDALRIEASAKDLFKPAKDMFKGFRTESVEQKYLNDLLATLINSDIVSS